MSKIEKFLESVKNNGPNDIAEKTSERYKIIYDSLGEITKEFSIYILILQYESEDVIVDILIEKFKNHLKEIRLYEDYGKVDYEILDHKNTRDILSYLIEDEYKEFCNFYIDTNLFPKIKFACGTLELGFFVNGLFATYNEIKYKYDEYSYMFISRICEMEEKIKNKFIDAVIDILDNEDNITCIRFKYDIEAFEGRI